MGNVKVSYKQRRGAHEAGDEINNPEEFFTAFLKEDFPQNKAMFNQLNENQKSQFKSIFDGEDLMSDKAMAETVLTEMDFNDPEDVEKARQLMVQIKDLMKQMPNM